MIKTKLSLVSFVTLLIASPVFADDSDANRGRLPDGRAFRTDAQGNQLVDYIAELELSVEQLTRRVNGLEFEVSEKQKQIERASIGESSNSGLKERDLLQGREIAADSPAVPGGFVSPAAQPRAHAQAEPQYKDCSAEVGATQQLLEKTKFDLDVARRVQDKSRAEYEDKVEKLKVQYGKLSCPKADCSMDIAKVSAETARVQEELEQTRAAISAERDAQLKRIQGYEATVAQLKSDLAVRDEKLQAGQVQLAALAAKEAKPCPAVVSAPEPKVDAAPVVAAVREVEPISRPTEQYVAAGTTAQLASRQPRYINGSDQRASFSAAKNRAVDGLRGSMVNDLNRLRDLINTRDNLFRGYNQSGRALSFKPSQLVSGRGFTYSWVTERVRSAENIYELSALSRDIREIRTRVQDDIDLIKRMQRR